MKKRLSVALALFLLVMLAVQAAGAELVTFLRAEPSSMHYYMQDPNKLKVQFQVQNTGYKTIKAFDYCVYAENEWGGRVYGSDYVYTQYSSTKIEPGDEKWSEYIIVPGRKETSKLYFAIQCIYYADGTYQYVTDSDLSYWYWRGPFVY